VCGIVGYLNLNGKQLSENNYLPKMCQSIAHRGPDEIGMKELGPVALGMTRLAIIDLGSGQQPMTNEDDTIWIVFNGEIYNFHELQRLVESKGHILATKSDTETIVHLYEEFGIDCLQYLEGMFSLAIWDKGKERLFLARDRMGEKPLHWTIVDGQFIFSSEIKGILAHPKSKRELNTNALEQYLTFEYVPAPNSIFKDIHKLMPAHYLIVEKGQVEIKPYWQPQINSAPISEEEACSKLLSLLKKSIELRLISDVPLGVFLSGGIDSSTIAAIASEKVSGQLNTFSIGFPDPSFDESSFGKIVANHLGTNHHCVEFEARLALDTMTELWKILDEPIADASILPTFFLSKMTKQNVTVALAGEGGDELFGGYPTYQAHKLVQLWKTVPAVLRKAVIEPLLMRLPVSLNNLSFDYKVKRFIAAANDPPIRRHLRWMGSFPAAEQSNLLLPSAQENKYAFEEDLLNMSSTMSVLMPELTNGNDIVEFMTRFDLSTYLPDDLLVKSDRASMAASLEVRLPFLAYPLVEFALSLPSNLKVKGWTSKYILKQVAAQYLPDQIIKRPKKGFGIPVGKWVKEEFKPVVDELLNETFIRKQAIFNWSYINNLLSEHASGKLDRRKEIWTLLMFQWWWSKFLMSSPG